jgi:hypothetical protein
VDSPRGVLLPLSVEGKQSAAKPKPGIASLGEEKIGWGGRIRTFTILINSEVSYRLDHAPAGLSDCLRQNRSR